MFSFQKTEIWVPLRDLTSEIYLLVNQFPNHEEFALKQQIRRAIVSVSLNLAEGTTRNSGRDQALYYKYAYGSLAEAFAGLLIAHNLHYLKDEQLSAIEVKIDNIARQLNGLKKYHLNR